MENKKTHSKIKAETFNIKKALDRINWRFKNESIKVNESKIIINELDQKAVDFLNEWINRQNLDTVQDNYLFAKIYVHCFKQELIYYNGNAKLAIKKINEILEIPIDFHYSEITDLLNNFELINYRLKIGLDNKHPFTRTKEENLIEVDLINENKKNILEHVKGVLTHENVFKSLNKNINDVINKYKK